MRPEGGPNLLKTQKGRPVAAPRQLICFGLAVDFVAEAANDRPPTLPPSCDWMPGAGEAEGGYRGEVRQEAM